MVTVFVLIKVIVVRTVTALITAVIMDTITNGQLEWAVSTYGSTATLAIG
jgi:hypothetical protein